MNKVDTLVQYDVGEEIIWEVGTAGMDDEVVLCMSEINQVVCFEGEHLHDIGIEDRSCDR